MIHPTAVIHARAELDPSVEVGPFVVVDAGVTVGPHCLIGPYVYLTGLTTLGAHNRLHAGCVVGDAPQDLKYRGEPTRLRIGDHNIIRENVTVHRSAIPERETLIGAHNLLMEHCHVAHDVVLGNHVILASGALLAGHVAVADHALISGNCLVHQFIRVGTLAMMQGGSGISKDLPPFTVARGDNGICGLNIVGLRRAGFTIEQRLELKRLYHALFRSGRKLSEALAAGKQEFTSPTAAMLLDFVASSKRGVCADIGRSADDENVED